LKKKNQATQERKKHQDVYALIKENFYKNLILGIWVLFFNVDIQSIYFYVSSLFRYIDIKNILKKIKKYIILIYF
jgi:hypothetical protein